MMLSRIKNVVHFRNSDPATVVVIGVLVYLAVVFFWGFSYADIAAKLLPAGAITICISMLLVPQRKLTFLLAILTGVSIPFAHFALFLAFGEGIQWTHLFGGLLAIHMVARWFLGHKVPIAPSTPWVLGLLGASVISLIAGVNGPGELVVEFWKSEVQLIFAVALYLAVTQIKVENKNILLMLKIMILVSVGVAIFGFYQLPARFYGWPYGVLRLTNPSLSSSMQSADIIFYMVRSSSIFSEPSYYGHYMNGMIALNLVAALHHPRLFGKPWVTWLILGIQALGLLVSFAMSSFYILALVALVMILTENRRGQAKMIAAFVIIGTAGILLMLLIEALSDFSVMTFMLDRASGIWMYVLTGDRTELVGPESIVLRVDTANIALNVWADHPIFGVGLGGYALISYLYGNYNPGGFSANAIVNTLAEMGIVGTAAFFGIIFTTLHGLWRVLRKNLTDDDPGQIKLIARMVFFLCLVEILYFHIQGSFFWPSVWYYLGLGGLVAVNARQAVAQANQAE